MLDSWGLAVDPFTPGVPTWRLTSRCLVFECYFKLMVLLWPNGVPPQAFEIYILDLCCSCAEILLSLFTWINKSIQKPTTVPSGVLENHLPLFFNIPQRAHKIRNGQKQTSDRTIVHIRPLKPRTLISNQVSAHIKMPVLFESPCSITFMRYADPDESKFWFKI